MVVRTHIFRRGSWWLAPLLGVSASVFGGEGAVSQAEIARAVAELGDANVRVRERAMRLLGAAGTAAEAALAEASGSAEAEVANRARDLLDDLRLGIRPDTPARAKALARAYRRGGDVEGKRAAVEALAAMGPKAYAVLAKLSMGERDAEVRGDLFGELAGRATELAAELIVGGEFAEAESVLEIGAGSGGYDEARAYAALAAARGTLKQRIGAFESVVARGPGNEAAAVVLCFLHRADGDLAAARKAAEQSGDGALVDHMMVEAGDWEGIVERAGAQDDDEGEVNLRQLGLFATYQRRAGNAAAAERTLDRVRKQADDPEKGAVVAEALLMNGKVEEAAALYEKRDEAWGVFGIRTARGEYGRAVGAARKAIAKDMAGETETASGIEVPLGRLLHHLGEPEAAEKVLRPVATTATEEHDAETMAQLVSVDLERGEAERAAGRAARFLRATEGEGAGALMEALFPGRGAEAVAWRRMLGEASGSEMKTMARVREAMEGKLGSAELEKRAKAAAAEAPKNPRALAEEQLGALGRALRTAGRTEAALAAMEAHCGVTESAGPFVELGDFHAERGRWAAAAGAYAGAMEKDSTRALPVYLRGWALAQGGEAAEGREWMARGAALPLGDDAARAELAKELRQRGLVDAAREQRRMLIRVGMFDGYERREAVRTEAGAAREAGDAKEAARLLEGAVGSLQGAEGHVTTAHRLHRAKAVALLEGGEVEKGLAEIAAAEALVPGDTELPIEVTPLLKKLGRTREAEGVVARARGANEKELEAYPRSPLLHNATAWLLARTGRDLEAALVHATKAAEMRPRDTAILDTLGEIYFQMGRREAAVETMRKCVELEPGVGRHRAALERFEKGRPETAPPGTEG